MPFCPSCGAEYREGFAQCNECGVALVAELPPGEEEPELRLVKLTEFILPMEADLLKELLEKNGVQALVRGEMDPLGVVSGAQPVALLVAEADLPQAMEIYEAFFDRFTGEGEEGEEGAEEPTEE